MAKVLNNRIRTKILFCINKKEITKRKCGGISLINLKYYLQTRFNLKGIYTFQFLKGFEINDPK